MVAPCTVRGDVLWGAARVGDPGDFEEAASCQFSRTLDLLFSIAFKKRIVEWQGLRAVGEGGGSGEERKRQAWGEYPT
jgi:hypothetical protein